MVGLLAVEFLRTRAFDPPATLSRRPPLGREDGVVVECSFCWCRRSRSLLAKQRVHSEQAKGFSLVCDRSCRLRCSSLAKERMQVVQTWGRGLSVFGGGNCGAAGMVDEEELDLIEALFPVTSYYGVRIELSLAYHCPSRAPHTQCGRLPPAKLL